MNIIDWFLVGLGISAFLFALRFVLGFSVWYIAHYDGQLKTGLPPVSYVLGGIIFSPFILGCMLVIKAVKRITDAKKRFVAKHYRQGFHEYFTTKVLYTPKRFR